MGKRVKRSIRSRCRKQGRVKPRMRKVRKTGTKRKKTQTRNRENLLPRRAGSAGDIHDERSKTAGAYICTTVMTPEETVYAWTEGRYPGCTRCTVSSMDGAWRWRIWNGWTRERSLLHDDQLDTYACVSTLFHIYVPSFGVFY